MTGSFALPKELLVSVTGPPLFQIHEVMANPS